MAPMIRTETAVIAKSIPTHIQTLFNDREIGGNTGAMDVDWRLHWIRHWITKSWIVTAACTCISVMPSARMIRY